MAETIPPNTATCSFERHITASPWSAAHIAEIRRDLREWLHDHPRADDAVTVADELLSNALVHGSREGGRVSFVASRLEDEYLEIDVRDTGRTADEPPCVTTEGLGRGLDVVNGLCAEVVIDRCGGWFVHAVLAATAPPIVIPVVDIRDLLADDDGSGTEDGHGACPERNR